MRNKVGMVSRVLIYSYISLLDYMFRTKFYLFIIFPQSPYLNKNLLTGESKVYNQSYFFARSEESTVFINAT